MFNKNRIKIQKFSHTNGFPYYSGNIRSTGRTCGRGRGGERAGSRHTDERPSSRASITLNRCHNMTNYVGAILRHLAEKT